MDSVVPHSILEKGDYISISVQAKPNSKKDSIQSIDDESVVVAISAQAKEGEANRQLIKYLSEVLQIKKTSISLSIGCKSKYKVIVIKGLKRIEVYTKLASNIQT